MDKKLMGKKSRASGMRFEAKVRADLESKNWIVSKWQNNVELEEKRFILSMGADKILDGKLIKAKPKFVYSPQLKRRIPMGMSSGFPDFLIFRRVTEEIIKKVDRFMAGYVPSNANKIKEEFKKVCDTYEVIGCESKMDGKLDKIEKEKCKWLLDNRIFSKILIASKSEKRGQIVYKEWVK